MSGDCHLRVTRQVTTMGASSGECTRSSRYLGISKNIRGGPAEHWPSTAEVYALSLSDVIEVAELHARDKLFPFSRRISVSKAVGLTRVAKHDGIPTARHHYARAPVARARDAPAKVPRG